MEGLGFSVAGGEASEGSLLLVNPRPDLVNCFGGCDDGGGVKLPAESRGGERNRSSRDLSISSFKVASTREMLSLRLLRLGEGVRGIAISDILDGDGIETFRNLER